MRDLEIAVLRGRPDESEIAALVVALGVVQRGAAACGAGPWRSAWAEPGARPGAGGRSRRRGWSASRWA